MKVKKVLFVVAFCIFSLMIFTNIVNATENEIEEIVTTIVQTPVITPDTSNEGETVEEYEYDEIFVEVENEWDDSPEGIIPVDGTPKVDTNNQPEILIYEMPSDEPGRITYVSYVTEEMDEFDNLEKLHNLGNLENDSAIYLNIIFANIVVFVVVILMIIISLIKNKKDKKEI